MTYYVLCVVLSDGRILWDNGLVARPSLRQLKPVATDIEHITETGQKLYPSEDWTTMTLDEAWEIAQMMEL